MSKKTGRKKEKGGHKRINISLDKQIREKLEKLKSQGGNVSQFIEDEIKPTLEKLDPAEQSIHIYRIQIYLSNQIIEALKTNDFETVKVIGSIASAFDNYRKLANIPPLNLDFEPSKVDSDFLEYCIKQGLITKEELDKYANAQTLLKILPKNHPARALLKLDIFYFKQKIESLKELKEHLI